MPIAPVLIAAWLAERADQGASRSTISVALAALKSAHRDAGHRFDGNDAILCSTLRGIRRTLIAPARQVAALSSGLLTDMLLAAGPSDLEMRDAAMLSCLYVFALRRSELAGLDFEIAGSGTGVISLTPATIELQLYRSKSSQTEPRRLSVPMSTSPLAVAAIERWVARARISEQEPLMRRILGHERIGGRLTGGGIAIAVKAAVERHLLAKGLPAEVAKAVSKTFAGHSGRLGFVTSSHEAGATELAIAAVTRHKDTTLVNRYARQADQKRTSPHQLPGVGV
jgi:integrase